MALINLARKNQSRLKVSISLENFNPDLQNSPTKIGVWWVARLKFSISLEIFKILNFFNLWALNREEKSIHNHHHGKKIIWRTFLASKKNFPGRWWIQKPYKTRKTISTTEIFPLWTPFFLQRKVLHWSRAVYAVFFPA